MHNIITIFRCISFVFPYGASLNVAKPAAPILTSGSVAYPLNRPLCAFYSASKYSNEGIIKKKINNTQFALYYIMPVFTSALFYIVHSVV